MDDNFDYLLYSQRKIYDALSSGAFGPTEEQVGTALVAACRALERLGSDERFLFEMAQTPKKLSGAAAEQFNQVLQDAARFIDFLQKEEQLLMSHGVDLRVADQIRLYMKDLRGAITQTTVDGKELSEGIKSLAAACCAAARELEEKTAAEAVNDEHHSLMKRAFWGLSGGIVIYVDATVVAGTILGVPGAVVSAAFGSEFLKKAFG